MPNRIAAIPAVSTGCDLPKDTDAEWRAAEIAELQAIAAGDRDAFARLMARETPRLLRLAGGMLGNIEEAEDAVQETMIRLWEHAARWTPDARIGTWLHKVCYNHSVDRLRRRRPAADESALDDMSDDAALPDATLLQGEAVRSVREAIDRLPERQRSAVLLFHIQDLPQSEAAGIMGVSESAFESLLARARRQLRRMLSPEGADDEPS